MPTTHLTFQKDLQGFNTFARDFSNLIYTGELVTAGAKGITVPSTYPNWEARIAVEYNAVCWVSVNNTAAVPASGDFAAATSELIIPAQGYEVKVKAGDTISVFNDTGADVNVSIALYVVINAGQ